VGWGKALKTTAREREQRRDREGESGRKRVGEGWDGKGGD